MGGAEFNIRLIVVLKRYIDMSEQNRLNMTDEEDFALLSASTKEYAKNGYPDNDLCTSDLLEAWTEYSAYRDRWVKRLSKRI